MAVKIVSSNAMPAVELSTVSARYDRHGTRGVERLRNVSFSLDQGELCALLGPNGAGKSSLIRLISGQLQPSAGTVELFGQSPRGSERARQVAIVPQRSEVALGFTVRDVVAMGRAPHQGDLMRQTQRDRDAIDGAIDTCKLGALVSRRVDELSGGEQKRVHIARALAQQAPILLLDEAAAHLDIRHATTLYELAKEEVRARQLACLFATHDLNAAAQHAERVVLLRDGQVVADGPTSEVMTSEVLQATFGVAVTTGVIDGKHRYFLPATTCRGVDQSSSIP